MSLHDTHCFAVPGESHAIDTIDPLTGKSRVNGHDLETIRQRYPAAEIMLWSDYLAAKSAAQETPIEWLPTTEEKYWEMLEVLPPADQRASGFLVGEAWDHHAITGKPRFACYRDNGDGTFSTASRPMTRAEFRAILSTN